MPEDTRSQSGDRSTYLSSYDFIDNIKDDVDRLDLLGDILDFYRRDPVGVLLENTDIIQKLMSLKQEINVSCVYSAPP
ncbi:MAG: hypothetical protein U9N36_12110 [Euryarchaeota archaeon]|nr:hypothetical protein [Euryarchaeota archaeon]